MRNATEAKQTIYLYLNVTLNGCIPDELPQLLAVSKDKHARGHHTAHEERRKEHRSAATHVASSFPPEGDGLVRVAASHFVDARAPCGATGRVSIYIFLMDRYVHTYTRR